MLYVWELTQIHHYVHNYPSDRLLIKITVALTLVFDTIATIGGFAFVYLDAVVHWGDQEYLVRQPWAESLYVAATGVSAAITQAFLVQRYWSLTGHLALSVVMYALVVASLVGSFACATILVLFPDYALRGVLKWSISVWFGSSAATDIFTAVALLIQFIRIDATFKSTKRLMRRLVTLTIKTGTVTALWALSILGTYLAFPEYNVCTGLGFCMGRVYTLTLLFNLNIRRSLRRHDTMIDVESIHLEYELENETSNSPSSITRNSPHDSSQPTEKVGGDTVTS